MKLKTKPYSGRLLIIKMIGFTQNIVEFTSWGELKNQINSSFVIEIAEQTKNIIVSEM